MIGEEVRKMKNEELGSELSRLRMSLFDLRSQRVTDKVADTSQFRKVRRDIARLLTERRARQIAKAGGQPVSKAPKAEAKAATRRAKAGAKAVKAAKPAAGAKAKKPTAKASK